jgi:hypothetical protein
MPGRTQALNFFAIGPQDQPNGFLVDMPGYGYATAPGAVRESWIGLAGDYLRTRQPLVAVVLMLDIRRGVTALDHGLLDWTPVTIPVLGLLTKADKLSRNQQQAAMRAVRAELALRLGEALGLSDLVGLELTARAAALGRYLPPGNARALLENLFHEKDGLGGARNAVLELVDQGPSTSLSVMARVVSGAMTASELQRFDLSEAELNARLEASVDHRILEVMRALPRAA